MNSALENLQKELDRSAVISKEFKSFILGWAMEACRISFEAGLRTGKSAVQQEACRCVYPDKCFCEKPNKA